MIAKQSHFSLLLFFLWMNFLVSNHSLTAQSNYFNVENYGAVGDGKMLNTSALQMAIDTCSRAGGGTVYFPAGKYLSGTLYFKDNITFLLDNGATLLGSTNLADYPPTRPQYRSYTDNYTERSLIYAEKCENIAIVGQGVLDGQGQYFTKERLPYKNRPYMLRIIECKNVTVRDVTIQNSPMWVQHYLACEHVVIDGVNVFSRRANLNGDGIDIDSCDKVFISNCFVDAEDDAIVLKATSNRPCKNVMITNCVLSSHCNAFKCGTESNGGFQDITVSNCTIIDTRYSGIALELVDGGEFNRVNISNITMRDVNNVIFIRLGNRARPYLARSEYTSSTNIAVGQNWQKPGMGPMQNIKISNIQATGVGSFVEKDPLPIHRESYDPRIGCSITGLPGFPVKNISIENVSISCVGGGTLENYSREIPENPDMYPNYQMLGITPSFGFYCRHLQNVRFRNIDLEFETKDERPAMVFDDVSGLKISDLSAESTNTTPAIMELNNVQSAHIQGCVADKAQVFVTIKGASTGDVSITNNDARQTNSIVNLSKEVNEDAVFLNYNQTR